MTPALSVDGIDVFIEGQGEHDLVMLHGWPDTWRLWDAQVEHFKSSYRCVRFTLPGFDNTKPAEAWPLQRMVDTLKRIIDTACAGRPVVLMMHDWGALFGYELLSQHPQLATRLVAVDVGDAGSKAHVAELDGKAKAGVAVYQLWLALAWCIGGRLGDRMTRWMARQLRCPAEPAHIGALMNYPYLIQWSGRHGGYKQRRRFEPTCPTLFIYGTRKPFMFHSRRWADALAARPGCAVAAVRNGHWLMVKAADEFNRAVHGWLQPGATR
jgi:pimeloyl-ACP methyl ester carboxylesterase